MYIPVFCWVCNRDSKNREGRTKQKICRTESIDKEFTTIYSTCTGCGMEHSQIIANKKLETLKHRGLQLYGTEKNPTALLRCQCNKCSSSGNKRFKSAIVLIKTLVNHGTNHYFVKVRFLSCGHIRIFLDMPENTYERMVIRR